VLATLSVETETELVLKAREGDRNAYGEIIRRHHQGVVHIVYRMCGDVQLAEDAAQETFLRAWLRLTSFRPDTSLRNWLYRIAVNYALDSLRRKPQESFEDEAMMMVTDQAPGPEAALIKKEQVELLQQGLQALPEASRSVLVLREYGELSYQEIATILDIPVGTVMSRLNYARNRLREVLKVQLLHKENEYV
jgi:RNA polymerase sigma-70 factor, ECF subfamily